MAGAIRVSLSHFSGMSNVHSRDPNGLAAIIRGLATDNARLAIASAAVPDFIDNSTGAAQAAVPSIPDLVNVDATTATTGAKKSDVDAGLVSFKTAAAALAENLNKARVRLGMTPIAYTGAPATSGTVPAVVKAVAGVSGAAAVSRRSAVQAFEQADAALAMLAAGTSSVLVALGFSKIPSQPQAGYASLTIPAAFPTQASTNGSDSVTAASAAAALTALANGLATIQAAYNANLSQAAQATTPMHVIAA